MNSAAFTMVAMKDVNTVGAPSYTSGVQKWKGAADTLNAMENISNSNPAPIIGVSVGSAQGNLFDIERSFCTVDETDTHQHDTGGERAHEEIFQTGFIALQISLIRSCEDVKRNGNDLDTEEEHQQGAEAGRDTDASEDKKDQCIIFGNMQSHFLHITAIEQEVRGCTSDGKSVEQQPEVVEGQHAGGIHIKQPGAVKLQQVNDKDRKDAEDRQIANQCATLAERATKHHYHSPDSRYYNCIHN